MILKKTFFINRKYLIIFLISALSFVTGIFVHDAKITYHVKQSLLNKSIVTKNFLNNFFFHDIPELKIDIPFKTQDYLKKNLAIAIKYNDLNLAENEYKAARITFKDKSYKVRIQLKGLLNDHRLEKKKSLRLKINSKENGLTKTILGLSYFNLMDPKRRSNEREWLFRKVAKDEGLIERRYDFVKVKINGDKPGVYAIEENFSKEFFEYNKIKPAPIIGIDSEKIRGVVNFNNCCGHIWINDFNFSPTQSKNKIFEDQNFNSQYNYAKKKLIDFLSGKDRPNNIINLEKFAKFLALSDIFGGWHGSETSNLKLYFNPYNSLLEPIPDDLFDAPREKPSRDFAIFRIRNIPGYSVFYEKLFNSNEFLDIYYKYLKKFSDSNYIQKVLKNYSKELNFVEKKISKDDLYFKKRIDQQIIQNSKSINEFLNPNYPIEIINVSRGDDNYLKIDLQNNFYFPIYLRSIRLSDKMYEINEVLNPKRISLNSIFEGAFFHILKKPKRKEVLIKLNKNQKFSEDTEISYSIENDEIKSFFVKDFNPVKFEKSFTSNINEFKDQLEVDDDSRIIKILNNELKIDKDLYFPKNYNLILDKNIKISLEKNSHLILESNIISANEKNIELNFIANGNNCILFKDNQLKVKKITFEGFSQCKSSGSYLTSGINFFRSKFKIDTLIAKNNKSGDDLINIIKSQFEINNLYIENSLYDGLDIDYSEGNIVNLKCFDCGKREGGDGVDLSHSNIFIEDIVITNSFDKGLSIGENTNVNIRNLFIKNANVCLANKDGSYTKIRVATLEKCNIGLAAFNKKSYYDPSKIEISKINFDENKYNLLRDEKNKIIIGGWEHNDFDTIDKNILSKIYE